MMSLKRLWGELRQDALTRLFFALYMSIACATFIHSATGFASIEGNILLGYLSATSVDIGMILSASGLRINRNIWLILGLTVSALASTFTQLLFSVSHAQAVIVAPGALWLNDVAQQIINLRIIVLPALLPALAIIYAFSAKAPLAPIAEMPQQTKRRKATIDDWRTIRANLNGNDADLDAQRVATILEDAGFLTPSATTLRNWSKMPNDSGDT